MSSAVSTSAAGRGSQSGALTHIGDTLLRYIALMLFDAFTIFLIVRLIGDGVWELAIVFGVITLFVNVINLSPNLVPLRWMTPALALMTLMVIYPIIYTVYVSFTNYGDGHLLTKQQVAVQLSRERYLPEEGLTFDWEPYINANGEYGLLLINDAGEASFLQVNVREAPVPVELVDGEAPEEINGFTYARAERFRMLQSLGGVELGSPDSPLGLGRREVASFAPRFSYDSATGNLTDLLSGEVYVGDDVVGTFINRAAYDAALAENPNANYSDYVLTTTTYPTGAGYRVVIGPDNFVRFLTSPAIRGPLITIFIWTFVFAFMSVFTTFTLGLLIALMLQAKTPGKRLFRTLLIVPYALPAVIAVGTWKGMVNPTLGVVGKGLSDLLGQPVPVFSDPTVARITILLINLWLGYPYFMLVCSGALASIPRDMYEAAEVDGANWWQQFWSLTLPMLLVAVGPLLIASFTFNFNNFIIIDAFNEGGPPIAGTPTPAGHTDILISYAYRLAFGSGRGADYGLASAITMIIFAIVAIITLFQFRFTRQWEEVSENV